jgi:hypothetical protein
MCVSKDLVATVTLLNDSTTDHYPLLESVMIDMLPPASKSIVRRNFKKVTTSALNQALESWHRDWSNMLQIEHPDAILAFINERIVYGMDLVSPVKRITVKDSALPPYLWPDTLALRARRDSLGRGPNYKSVRNRVTALVRRDKEHSNLANLAESKNSPTVLWEIANAAVGKPCQPLPGSVKDMEGNNTVGNLEALNVVNAYYAKKVPKTWANTREVEKCCSQRSTTSRDEDTRRKKFNKPKSIFLFTFANAGKIAKVISRLKATAALGTNGILVAILKMGSDVLAGPILHLAKMLLATGIVPEGFKTALIHPVYKGGGKSRKEPALYRPVAILCAMSKVLPTVTKEDLEAFMKANYILPASQHGFRKGRLCTTALATAHAAWVSANKSKVVAVIGFDLSATFDTVGREDLLPKMSAIDIGGKALKWFRCYLTNAKQHVVWEGHMPDIVDVEYGVWQGSLLGPVL